MWLFFKINMVLLGAFWVNLLLQIQCPQLKKHDGGKKKVLIKIERKMLGYFVRVHSNAGISPLAAPKPG